MGPIILKTHRKLSTEKSQTDAYYKLLFKYIQSSFRGFESYLRILTPEGEDDIQLTSTQYIPKFITNKTSAGV